MTTYLFCTSFLKQNYTETADFETGSGMTGLMKINLSETRFETAVIHRLHSGTGNSRSRTTST